MSRIANFAEKTYFNWTEKEIELLQENFSFFASLFGFILFTLCGKYSEIASLHFLRRVELFRFALLIASQQYGHEAYPLQREIKASEN